jgi:hypothetical protein
MEALQKPLVNPNQFAPYNDP